MDFTLTTLDTFSYVTSRLYAPTELRIALERLPAQHRPPTNQDLLNPVGTSALSLKTVEKWFQEQRAVLTAMGRQHWPLSNNPAALAASILFGFNAQNTHYIVQVAWVVGAPKHLSLEDPRATFRLLRVKDPSLHPENPGAPLWWKGALKQPLAKSLPQMNLRERPQHDNWEQIEIASRRRLVLLPNPPRISMRER